jgi:hypothetical protein
MVNGKGVFFYGFDCSSDAGSWGGIRNVLPVQTGDVLTVGADNPDVTNPLIICNFIPPKLIVKQLPVVVEKNGSYSLDEVKTADTWVDGKPIYRKVFTGNIVSDAGVKNISQLTSGVDDLVAFGGWWCIGGTNANKYLIGNLTDIPDVLYNAYLCVDPTSGLYFLSTTNYARDGVTNSKYQIWAEYTKTTA